VECIEWTVCKSKKLYSYRDLDFRVVENVLSLVSWRMGTMYGSLLGTQRTHATGRGLLTTQEYLLVVVEDYKRGFESWEQFQMSINK